MKLGIESRNKTIAACVLAAIALFLFWRSFFTGGGVPSAPPAPAQFGNAVNPQATPATRNRPGQRRNAPVQITENPLDPRLRLAMLKTSEDTEYKGAGRNIFRAEAEPVVPTALGNGTKPKPNPTPQPPPQPTGPPPPPPIPLKFFGFANRSGGARQIFLSKGDDVFVAKEGDVVDRHYKVLKINATSVEIQDLFNNNTQTIPLTAGQP